MSHRKHGKHRKIVLFVRICNPLAGNIGICNPTTNVLSHCKCLYFLPIGLQIRQNGYLQSSYNWFIALQMLIFLTCRIANPTERASSSFCGNQHCSSDEMTHSPCRDAPWRVRHRLCLRREHGRFRGASLQAKRVMLHFVWAWRREAQCCRRGRGRLLRWRAQKKPLHPSRTKRLHYCN